MRQRDARIAGTGVSPPSTVILDFMYGVIAYQCWGSGQAIKEVLQERFTDNYESIPIPLGSPHSSDSSGFPERDNPDDGDYIPYRQVRGRNHSSNVSDGVLQAMDDVLALSMFLKGTSPESMAAERQRQEEVEELHEQEASVVKVQGWQQHPDSPCVISGYLPLEADLRLNRYTDFQSDTAGSHSIAGTRQEEAEKSHVQEVEELHAQEATLVKMQQWMQHPESPCVISGYFPLEADLRLNSEIDFQSNAAISYSIQTLQH